MALSPTAAEVSTKNNNVEIHNNAGTNNTGTQNNVNPQNVMQNKLEEFQAVKDYIGSFLEDSEMGQLRKTARFLRYTNQNDVDKRKTAKRVRKELLVHAFGASPDVVNLFLSNPVNLPSLLLTKTYFREGYDSKKFEEFVCFREWQNVSTIQAIALSGDECFLRDILVNNLIMNDKLRLEALIQLEEVQKRMSDQKTIKLLMDAIDAIIGMNLEENTDFVKADAKTRLEEIQQSPAFQQQMQEFIDEMEELRLQLTEKTTKILEQAKAERAKSGNNFAERESIAEKKGNKENVQIKIENSQIKYADNAEFLAPVLKLLKAYVYYFIQYPNLYAEQNNDKIDELWEYVGECHRRLPHYVKQEFFNDKPFSINPPPAFKTAPNRSPCRYWNKHKELLDLDGLGIGTFFGLYRGLRGGACAQCMPGRARRAFLIDLAAIAHLYKVREAELENIIELLSGHRRQQKLDPNIP